MRIPFHKPSITKKERKAVQRVLKSGWLTTGKEVLDFELDFADHINVKHALAVNSCTSGLFLALKACEIGKGDEVLLPSFTFVATANVIKHCGAKPVFCDIDETLTLCPESVRKNITLKTKAIIGVHYNGIPCSSKIKKIADKNHLYYIEDCAHAFKGWTPQGIMGGIGDIGVFSFYATKPITTGEGGMITTSNEVMADRIKLMRNHGITKPVWDRYTNVNSSNEYDVTYAGYKFNMPDIMGAIGKEQLLRSECMAYKRKDIAEMYDSELITLGTNPSLTNHLYTLGVPDRDGLAEYLKSKGIGTSIHFKPVHTFTAYKKAKHKKLTTTELISDSILSLPIYPDLTLKEQRYIIKSVKEFLGG